MNYDEYLNVRMDKNLKKQLTDRAKKDGTTLGEQARKVLKQFVEEQIMIDMKIEELKKEKKKEREKMELNKYYWENQVK